MNMGVTDWLPCKYQRSVHEIQVCRAANPACSIVSVQAQCPRAKRRHEVQANSQGARHAQETKPKATERNWIGRQCFRAHIIGRKGKSRRKGACRGSVWRGAVASNSAATLLPLYQTRRMAPWLPPIGGPANLHRAGRKQKTRRRGGKTCFKARSADRGVRRPLSQTYAGSGKLKMGKQVQHCRAGDAWLGSIWWESVGELRGRLAHAGRRATG